MNRHNYAPRNNNYSHPFDYNSMRPQYGSQYQQKQYSNNQPQKKKSGCKFESENRKTGRPLMFGWNASRTRGLISFVASPRIEKHKTSSPRWENWAVKMQFVDGVKWFNGLYDLDKKRLIIKDLQMIANPSKNYFGKLFRSKN